MDQRIAKLIGYIYDDVIRKARESSAPGKPHQSPSAILRSVGELWSDELREIDRVVDLPPPTAGCNEWERGFMMRLFRLRDGIITQASYEVLVHHLEAVDRVAA